MIVRVMGEGQFRVSEDLIDKLNAIDNAVVKHVDAGDEAGYRAELARLIGAIKSSGEPLDPVEIIQSDIIVPPADMSMEEAKQVFHGKGLIED